ncbi:MAG: tRNA (guanosine(46)-N(7))-methyltransferase TrmB [Lysobacterales bacterium]
MQRSLSSIVRSTQTGLHPRLVALVRKHMAAEWRQPLHAPTVDAFTVLAAAGVDPEKKIVLDSGCGTGESTRQIAQYHPDCLVIGVDKSKARLKTLTGSHFSHNVFLYREGNTIWLRAELASFWRLAVQAGWRLHRHYLLYPNPWPKPGQVSRRWHAHPVFPTLLQLGGRLELRCNWEIYAREFAAAVEMAGCRDVQLTEGVDSCITTPFESKYRNSGQTLYRVVVPDLASRRQNSAA